MSDFDKEAERERLREKYERDKEKRASTQRMSELLLKGATMTNRHCDTCGDPIFRWNGREFCPTCDVEDGAVAADAGEPVEGADGDASEDATAATGAAADASAGDANANGADGSVTGRADGTAGEATSTSTSPSASPSPSPSSAAGPTESDRADGEAGDESDIAVRTPTDADPAARAPPTNVEAPARRDATEPATQSGTTSGDRDRDRNRDGQPNRSVEEVGSRTDERSLSTARASLSRTLARYAEAAERADDPRRAREYLEAAREAAETLAALRR
jgi:uncharacterized Zn finger protein (UPF0148 family)